MTFKYTLITFKIIFMLSIAEKGKGAIIHVFEQLPKGRDHLTSMSIFQMRPRLEGAAPDFSDQWGFCFRISIKVDVAKAVGNELCHLGVLELDEKQVEIVLKIVKENGNVLWFDLHMIYTQTDGQNGMNSRFRYHYSQNPKFKMNLCLDNTGSAQGNLGANTDVDLVSFTPISIYFLHDATKPNSHTIPENTADYYGNVGDCGRYFLFVPRLDLSSGKANLHFQTHDSEILKTTVKDLFLFSEANPMNFYVAAGNCPTGVARLEYDIDFAKQPIGSLIFRNETDKPYLPAVIRNMDPHASIFSYCVGLCRVLHFLLLQGVNYIDLDADAISPHEEDSFMIEIQLFMYSNFLSNHIKMNAIEDFETKMTGSPKNRAAAYVAWQSNNFEIFNPAVKQLDTSYPIASNFFQNVVARFQMGSEVFLLAQYVDTNNYVDFISYTTRFVFKGNNGAELGAFECQHSIIQQNYFVSDITSFQIQGYSDFQRKLVVVIGHDGEHCDRNLIVMKTTLDWQKVTLFRIGDFLKFDNEYNPILFQISRVKIFSGMISPIERLTNGPDKGDVPQKISKSSLLLPLNIVLSNLKEYAADKENGVLNGADCKVLNCQVCLSADTCGYCKHQYKLTATGSCELDTTPNNLNYVYDLALDLTKIPDSQSPEIDSVVKALQFGVQFPLPMIHDYIHSQKIVLNLGQSSETTIWGAPYLTHHNVEVNSKVKNSPETDFKVNQLTLINYKNSIHEHLHQVYPSYDMVQTYHLKNECEANPKSSLFGLYSFLQCQNKVPSNSSENYYFLPSHEDNNFVWPEVKQDSDKNYFEKQFSFAGHKIPARFQCSNGCKCDVTGQNCLQNMFSDLESQGKCPEDKPNLLTLLDGFVKEECVACMHTSCKTCLGDACIKCAEGHTPNNYTQMLLDLSQAYHGCGFQSTITSNSQITAQDNEGSGELFGKDLIYKCHCYHRTGFSQTEIESKFPEFEVCKLIKCGDNCTTCLNSEKCLECADEYTLSPDSKCAPKKTIKCKKGFVRAEANGPCLRIPNNCRTYTLDPVLKRFRCSLCEPGHDLDLKKRCRPVIAVSSLFDFPISQSKLCSNFRKNVCQTCNLGYYLFENRCLPCDSHSISCYFDRHQRLEKPIQCKADKVLTKKTSKCSDNDMRPNSISCGKNQYHSNQFGKCMACSRNCKVCSSSDKCQVCEQKFELSSEANCHQKCNIGSIFRYKEEEYQTASKQCLKCSNCEFCQVGRNDQCASCSKCENQCLFEFIKVSNGKFIIKTAHMDFKISEIQKRYTEIKFSKSNGNEKEILLQIQMADGLPEKKLEIRTSEIKTRSCILPVSPNILLKLEQQIYETKKMEEIVSKMNVALSSSKTGVAVASFLASNLGLLIEFINIGSLFNFGISKNNNENSLTGQLKSIQRSLFDPFAFESDRMFLGLSQNDETKLFYAFVASSLGQVWQIPFVDYIWFAVLIISLIMLGLCYLNGIWTPVFILLKEYSEFLRTDPSEDEIAKVEEHLDQMLVFRFFKKRQKLLKCVQWMLLKVSLKQYCIYCSFLLFNAIGDFSMLCRVTNVIRTFPGEYTSKLTCLTIFKLTVFFYFFTTVIDHYCELRNKKKLTIQQIKVLLKLKRTIYLVLQYQGLVLISLLLSRFTIVYHSGMMLYLFILMVSKIFSQSVFESFVQVFLVDIVLFAYFYFLNFYDLYVMNYLDSYLFDVFFVMLIVSHFANMIATCTMKVKPDDKT